MLLAFRYQGVLYCTGGRLKCGGNLRRGARRFLVSLSATHDVWPANWLSPGTQNVEEPERGKRFKEETSQK
jgi:hypothetical protein